MQSETKGKVLHLRDYFLAARARHKRIPVTAKLPDPVTGDETEIKVELWEPNGKERGQIFKAATVIKRNQEPEVDHAELQVWAVIMCARDPETGEKLFEEAHRDVLLSLPTSVFDILARPALQLLGEDAEEAAKNS